MKEKIETVVTYREQHPFYENRELSWLKFNERVIEEAMDETVPLCERLSFTSIFQSNLDEFFMVRVGSLYDQMLVSKDRRDSKTHMTAKEQMTQIFKTARILSRKKDKAYREIMCEIKKHGVEIVHFSSIKQADMYYLENYFKESIMPLLCPLVVGKKQPFPFIANKEIYAVALLGAKNNEKIAIVPCSNGVFQRLIPLSTNANRYVLVEELILHFMPQIFDNYQIKSKSLIRVIRNADIDVDEAFYDEDIDYRDSMEKLIKQRKKLCPVKLEYSRKPDEKIIENLCKEFGLRKEQLYYSATPLELSFVFQIQDVLRKKKELFYEKRVPQYPVCFDASKSIMAQIEQEDKLLSYPFESMSPFLKLLEEAGTDKRVVSIKMTLYRVAKNSQIVESLINAAEHGKEVIVLVELRARFDEENNIEWSRRLEDAGCRIIYGIDYTKVHSKLCLITYQDEQEIKYITQIGTGNYNEKTSKLYTDLSLMTSNKEIGLDAVNVFSKLCKAEFVEQSEKLLVAPLCLKKRVMEYMDEEIAYAKRGEPAFIGVKINSLTDKEIIDKLIECSQAGVKVELVVRGICCLVPEIESYTENISVVSIVGRYLEHSRIYMFGTPDRDTIYISSADFMTRNMEKRVEVATPILNESLKQRLRQMFRILMTDNVKGRSLKSDGIYAKKSSISMEEPKVNAQEQFFEDAYWNK